MYAVLVAECVSGGGYLTPRSTPPAATPPRKCLSYGSCDDNATTGHDYYRLAW